MASGTLMSLAYIIEMGGVFNLAYLELNKARYLEGPRREIEALKKRIDAEDEGPLEARIWMEGKTRILDKLDALTSGRRMDRQDSWKTTNYENRKHYDRTAGQIYEFFEKEKDKSLAQHFLVLIAVMLPIITILDHAKFDAFRNAHLDATIVCVIGLAAWMAHVTWDVLSPTLAKWMVALCVVLSGVAVAAPDLHTHSQQCDAWWFFFCLLGFGMVLPALFILAGRRLRTVLTEVTKAYAVEFEQLKSQSMGNIKLPKNLLAGA